MSIDYVSGSDCTLRGVGWSSDSRHARVDIRGNVIRGILNWSLSFRLMRRCTCASGQRRSFTAAAVVAAGAASCRARESTTATASTRASASPTSAFGLFGGAHELA